MLAQGIKIKKIGTSSFRMVIHCGTGAKDIDRVLTAVSEIVKGLARSHP